MNAVRREVLEACVAASRHFLSLLDPDLDIEAAQLELIVEFEHGLRDPGILHEAADLVSGFTLSGLAKARHEFCLSCEEVEHSDFFELRFLVHEILSKEGGKPITNEPELAVPIEVEVDAGGVHRLGLVLVDGCFQPKNHRAVSLVDGSHLFVFRRVLSQLPKEILKIFRGNSRFIVVFKCALEQASIHLDAELQ